MPTGLFVNRKGVSPIIASLMLVVISVASGAVAYVFIAGYASQSAPPTPTSAISVDNVSGNATNVTLYVRNSGSTDVVVDHVYTYAGGTLLRADDVNVTIPSSGVGEVVISRVGIAHGSTFNFHVVCTGNTMTATFNSYLD